MHSQFERKHKYIYYVIDFILNEIETSFFSYGMFLLADEMPEIMSHLPVYP